MKSLSCITIKILTSSGKIKFAAILQNLYENILKIAQVQKISLALFKLPVLHEQHEWAYLRVLPILFALFAHGPVGCNMLTFEEISSSLIKDLASDRPSIFMSSPMENTAMTDAAIPIFVWFDREMNHEITQNAFSLTGSHPVPGNFAWEGTRLSYIPERPLSQGGNYRLSVSGAAASDSGVNMGKEYIIHFSTGPRSDRPIVISSIPANNEKSANVDQSIEIAFSRPMDQNSAETAFSISPSKAGFFSWSSGGSVLTYTPYSSLSNGTTYNVSISTAAADTAGISLAENFSLTFQAGSDFVPPIVTGILEKGNTQPLSDGRVGISKDSSFEIQFSESMDYNTSENCILLKKVYDGSIVSGINSWNNSFTSLTIRPDAPLEPESEYAITVNACAKDVSGNNIQNSYYLNFFVNNSAILLNSNYMKIEKAICVNSPDSPETISMNENDFASIVTQIAGGVEIDVYFSNDLDPSSLPSNIFLSRTLDVYPFSSPGYITSIKPGALAGMTENGIKINIAGIESNDEYVLEFSGGRSGILSADNSPETSTWMKNNVLSFIKFK